MRDTFKYTDIDDLYDPDADDDDDKWVWDKVFKGPEEKQEQQPKSATGMQPQSAPTLCMSDASCVFSARRLVDAGTSLTLRGQWRTMPQIL